MKNQTLWLLGGLAAASLAALWYVNRSRDATGGTASGQGGALDAVTSGLQDSFTGIGDFMGITQKRGIRNNNPLNLRYIANPARAWNGQTGNDGGYGIYATPALGVRAASKQMQKDYAEKGGTTLADLITIWAPPTENNTAAYIADVSERTGLDPNAPLDLYDNLPVIVPAMIQHENGQQPYLATDIAQWVYLA